MMEDVLENEPKVEGPGGSTIGATTGTIMPGSSTSSSGGQAQPSGSTTDQATSSTTAASSTAQTTSRAGNFGEPQPITAESIARVTELGFSREEATAALRQADGNVELAISLLL